MSVSVSVHPDPSFRIEIAELPNAVCITLNEYPGGADVFVKNSSQAHDIGMAFLKASKILHLRETHNTSTMAPHKESSECSKPSM